jgi:hypothetical protein
MENEMKIIVCLEDNNGMMFNRRRVSSDAVVTRRILEIASGKKLWMSPYSSKLFAGENVCIADDFLSRAQAGEYCFVEDADIDGYTDRMEEMILFRWNRRYPSDRKFLLSLDEWKLVSTEEFAGKSHPLITQEVYER